MLECYKVRMVAAIDGLIWNEKVNKTAIEENVFRFIETEYPELSQQDRAFFHIDRIKEKIRKGTNALCEIKQYTIMTWNVIGKNFLSKESFKISFIKRDKMIDVVGNFQDGNKSSKWL